MLKNFSRGFSHGLPKFFTMDRVIIIIVFLILVFALYYYSGSKSFRMDAMTTGSEYSNTINQTTVPIITSSSTISSTIPSTIPSTVPAAQLSSGYTAQSVTAPQDLLPVDQNSQWSALNPVAQGNIAAPDLLQAGYHIGLDTIGQTLRNANLQERSDPIITKSIIGPWNQSTIEPDLGRVPLEVGAGQR